MNDTITPRTTAEWLSPNNKYNISAEDTEAAFNELADKTAHGVKNAIEAIGVAAVDANAFIEDLITVVKQKLENL